MADIEWKDYTDVQLLQALQQIIDLLCARQYDLGWLQATKAQQNMPMCEEGCDDSKL